METKVTDELVSTVRTIVGSDYSDMDIARALHMAKNDANAAINIIFDTPHFKVLAPKPISTRPPRADVDMVTEVLSPTPISMRPPRADVSKVTKVLSPTPISIRPLKADLDKVTVFKNGNVSGGRVDGYGVSSDNECDFGNWKGSSEIKGGDWWSVGWGDVACMSTSKGRKLKRGDEVTFTFPKDGYLNPRFPGRVYGRARQSVVTCSEIVRFSTKSAGEVF